MSAQSILILYLVFFFVEYFWELALSLLNLGHVQKNASEVPRAFAGVIDKETYARSVSYTITRGRFGLADRGIFRRGPPCRCPLGIPGDRG